MKGHKPLKGISSQRESLRLDRKALREQKYRILLEKQGILEFGSKRYDDFLEQIITDIYNYSGFLCGLSVNGEFIDKFYRIEYKNSVEWIRNLNVLYKFVPNYSSENYYCIPKEGFLIDGKVQVFKISNNRYDCASIVLEIPYLEDNEEIKDKKTELVAVLRHELKHLFYFLKTNILLEVSNKDILFYDTYEYKNPFLGFGHYINLYRNNKDKGLDRIYNNLDDFIVLSLYYLNLSECRSHLENIYFDIKRNLPNEDLLSDAEDDVLLYGFLVDFNKIYLSRLSPVYGRYSLLYEIYKDLYDEYNALQHKISIMDKLKDFYGVKSFRDFCLFMCQRIKGEILNKTEKLYTTLKN